MNNPSELARLQLLLQEKSDEIDRLREQLAASEATSEFRQELHQTLSSAVNIGYWEWDEITNKPAYFSEEMAAIMGISLESLYELYQSEEDYFCFVHPDDLQYYIDNLNAILNPAHPRGQAHTFHYRIVRPTGEVRHVLELEYGKLEKDGVISRSYGAIQDISELHESTRALKESEQRYSALFSKLPIGVMEQDWSIVKREVDKLRAEGVENLKEYFDNNPIRLLEIVSSITITSVNDRLMEIYDADSIDDFIESEEGVYEWWDEEWANLYASEIIALAGSEKFVIAEATETRMDYSKFYVRLMTSLVKGDEDTWKKVLTIVEDVTDRKTYETDLIEARNMAEEASKSKTEFLSNMSHELRTPLNAILGFSQLFEYDPSLGEKRQSRARAINNAGKHLLHLIDEILDLSRIETGNIELSMESVRLGPVLKASVSWVAEMAKGRGISIEFDPEVYSGVMVEADTVRLKQVFLNLLSNAVKYNCENGKISIDYQLDEQGQATISITDTGPGISTDRLGELFKPFNRLGAEFTAIEGTGIGLVITKRLVELMQGELKVDSKPGQGSIFTVQFQAIQGYRDGIEVSKSDEVKIDSLVINRPNILVAEDNPVNQVLMEAQLEALGYSAGFAEEGLEALELWRTGNYQLLLTDIRMPKMDGYELIRQIRVEELNTASIPIIAVTANAMESDIKKCLGVGANEVMPKPFTLEALKQILEKWSPREKPV